MQYARENTNLASGNSDVVKNGRPKVATVFIEPKGEGKLDAPWPKELDNRAAVLGRSKGDPSTLVALYERPREGGDFGYVANAVKEYYRRSGTVVDSTARALNVVDDIVSGRLKP